MSIAILLAALLVQSDAFRAERAPADPTADLIRDLDDESWEVRDAADKALRRMGAPAAPFVRAALARDPSAEAKGRLKRILECVSSVGKLIRQLGDDEYDVRVKAKEDLRAAGPGALPELRAAVNNPDAEVARAAGEIIDDLTNPRPAKPEVRAAPLDADGVDRAIKQLGDEDYNTRMQARKELQAAGATALPQLKKAAADPDLEVSQSANLIIKEITKNQK
jgi:HEAT repeat protein